MEVLQAGLGKESIPPSGWIFVHCICLIFFCICLFLWVCPSYFIHFFSDSMPCLALLCIDIIFTSTCQFKTTFSSFELEIHSTVSSVSIPKDFIFPESLKVPVSANLSFSFQSQRKKTPTMCHTASAPPPFMNSTNVGMFMAHGNVGMFRHFDIFFHHIEI